MFRVTKRTWTCLVKIWWLLQHYNTGRNYDAANLKNYVAVTSFPFPFPRCWMFCISWLPPSREHRETWGPGERWLTLHKFSWLFLNRRATTTRHTHGGCLACDEDQYFYWDLLKSHALPFGHLILSIGLIVNGCCPNRESSLISASKCWTNTSPADHLLKHLEPIMSGGRASSASKCSIRRFVITEKAPTRAFSWLKAATTAFTFKIVVG